MIDSGDVASVMSESLTEDPDDDVNDDDSIPVNNGMFCSVYFSICVIITIPPAISMMYVLKS